MTELNVASNNLGLDSMDGLKRDTTAIVALADAIGGMGALTSLHLSSNLLEAEGAKIAEAIEVTNYVIAVILAPFSCPSDHWLNYCCLLLSTGYEGLIGIVTSEQRPPQQRLGESPCGCAEGKFNPH
jgi:hypothetical protein